MHRKGVFKAFREDAAMIYRPPTLKALEPLFSCELGALERHTNGGFREESVFFGGRRDAPTPHPLDILPRIVGHFRHLS